MLTNIISDIICEEYEKNFRRKRHESEGIHAGMMIQFRSDPPTGHDDSIYHHTDLLLYTRTNYVGVYSRERWNPHTRNVAGESPWQVHCYHDSCWRSDGVGSFIFQNRDRLHGLDTFCRWYLTMPVNEEFEALLKSIRDERYNRKG
jgi:hypothetical protein